MTDDKPKRQRRTKASIEAGIEQAARDEIVANGFSASLVTNIIKKANIEPQVFYNRYKDIDEYFDSFVRKYDFCFFDKIDDIRQRMDSGESFASLLKGLMRAINSDPIALELLRWELNNVNATTKRTSAMRELGIQPIIRIINEKFKDSSVDVSGVIALIIGGVYYLLLRKKLSPFHGIDLNTEEGLAKVDNVIDYLVELVFKEK